MQRYLVIFLCPTESCYVVKQLSTPQSALTEMIKAHARKARNEDIKTWINSCGSPVQYTKYTVIFPRNEDHFNGNDARFQEEKCSCLRVQIGLQEVLFLGHTSHEEEGTPRAEMINPSNAMAKEIYLQAGRDKKIHQLNTEHNGESSLQTRALVCIFLITQQRCQLTCMDCASEE